MSDRDTDDTDALLAADPNGGLNNIFLGLSLKELSERHKNLLTPVPTTAARSAVAGSPASDLVCADLNKSSTETNSTLNNLELDTTGSDFYNTKGELVLSGLSEWTNSDSDSAESKSGNEDTHSDAGSVSSFTYENDPETINSAEDNAKRRDRIPEDELRNKETVDKESNAGNERQDDEIISFEQNELRKSIPVQKVADFQIQKHDPGAINIFSSEKKATGSFIPQFLNLNHNHSRVFDVNLLRPSAGWNIPVRPYFSAPGEQVFTRAPNFRTPGGYRPPINPKNSRDLTADQIHDEVLKMYAFPDEIDPEEEREREEKLKLGLSQPPKVLNFSEEVSLDMEQREAEEKSKKKKNGRKKVEFNCANGNQEPSVCGSTSEGKPTKRKHLIALKPESKSSSEQRGAGGDNIASEYLHLKFRNDVESITSPAPESISSSSIGNSVPYSTKVVRGKRGSEKKKNKSTRFSFGYGKEESELSPIKGISGRDVFPTPGSIDSPFTVDFEDLKSVWQDIQARQQSLQDSARRAVNISQNTPIIEDLGNVSESEIESSVVPTEKVYYKRQNERDCNDAAVNSESEVSISNYNEDKKHDSVSSSAALREYRNTKSNIDLQQNFVPMLEVFASDLEAILQEADIRPDEFEEIIDELGEGDDLVGAISAGELYDGFRSDDKDDTYIGGDISDSTTQAELSDWAKSGASEYVEKYYDEKFRRQECEVEIQKLQKEMLDIKQRNAVLEGNMKKKDMTLHKISSAWNQVSKEWKTHESTSKEALAKLQKEQEEILQACQQDKERIAEYEKELLTTVELADSFRSKIVELENAKSNSVQKLEEQNSKLVQKIEKLQKNVDNVCHEKNTALRALSESQQQLDEQKVLQIKMQSDLAALEVRVKESEKKTQKIFEQKEVLETHLQGSLNKKTELENQIKKLGEELNLIKEEKEDLKKSLGDAASRQVKAEGDRLHEYYNKKVQEVLKSATEKAAKAEACLMDSMRKASLDSERKLNECRERYQKEISRLKALYEAEVQALKKDNLNKQLLITTTAQQLSAGEVARSGAVDRLESIVSSIHPNMISSLAKLPKEHRRRGSDSDTLAVQSSQKQNSMQYSKFTQKLNASDNRNTLSTSQSVDFRLGLEAVNNTTASSRFGGSEILSNVSRYIKTSTPINNCDLDLSVSNNTRMSQSDVMATISKLFKQPEGSNSAKDSPKLAPVFSYNRTNSKSLTEGDSSYLMGGKSVNKTHGKGMKSLSSVNDVVKVMNHVEPVLELPVKLQKECEEAENLASCSNPSDQDSEIMIDPALQKCLEELIKSYAQKMDVIQSRKDSLITAVLQTETSSSALCPPKTTSQFATTTVVPSVAAVQPSQFHSEEKFNSEGDVTSASSNVQSSKQIDNDDNEGDTSSKHCSKGLKDSSRGKDKSNDNESKSGKRPWK